MTCKVPNLYLMSMEVCQACSVTLSSDKILEQFWLLRNLLTFYIQITLASSSVDNCPPQQLANWSSPISISEVTPSSRNRYPEYCLLSEEWNIIWRTHNKFSYSVCLCTLPSNTKALKVLQGLLYATACKNRKWAYLMRRQCYKTFVWEIGVQRGCLGTMKLWSLQLQSRCDTLHYNLWLNFSSQTVIKLLLKQFKHMLTLIW